jgi:hypothetical protein
VLGRKGYYRGTGLLDLPPGGKRAGNETERQHGPAHCCGEPLLMRGTAPTAEGSRRVIGLLLILALLACPLFAAPPTLTVPESVTGKAGAFIAIEAESDSPWVNFRASDGLNVFPAGLLSSKRATVVTGPVGTYRVWAYCGNKDGGVDREIVVTIGTPPVVVIPPKPDPEPPKPDPVVSGKRRLLLVHESADDTPEVSRLIVSLRTGTSAAYLDSKGHKLSILDDDSVDAAGKPAADVEQWRPHFAGMKLPALFVLDETGKTLLHKQEIPAGSTAAQVVEIVKGKGG